MNYHFKVDSVSAGRRNIYSDNEIELPVHGIVCITGNNGSGKTTLLNHIFYNNPDTIALIAQENDLIFNELSVPENIMLFNRNEEMLNSLAGQLNMTSLLNRKSEFLSGGEKRIVAVLRMFFVEKDIIFLDEPTNDLDYVTVDLICKMIKKLSEKKSIVIVTHDSRLLSFSDAVYRLENGILSPACHETEGEYLKPDKKEVKSDIKHFFDPDIAGLLFFFLILLSTVITGFFLLNNSKNHFVQLEENQTNIASMFYSGTESMLNNGYIPLAAYIDYTGDMNIDYFKKYQKHLEESLSCGGTLNMFFDENLGEEVYPVMITDLSSNQKHNIMNEYISERNQETVTRVIPAGISLFDGIMEISETDGSETKEKINIEKYMDIADTVIGGDSANQPVLYYVVNINKDQLSKLEGNYYIKNNLTVKIQKDIKLIENVLNGTKLLAVLLSSSIFLYFVYNSVMMKHYRKHVSVFRNMGIDYESLLKTFISRRGMLMIKLIVTLSCALVCFVPGIFDSEIKLLYNALSCICVASGIPVVLMTHCIMKRFVEKIYTFGGIYDN